MPYWRIQVIPDCIEYTIQKYGAGQMSINLIFGANGYNDKIFRNLEILRNMGAINLFADDRLYKAYLKYLAEESFLGQGFPFNRVDGQVVWDPAWGVPHRALDYAMLTDLRAFQLAACVGTSYLTPSSGPLAGHSKLPNEAKFAAFWDEALEVPLPRLTKAQFDDRHSGFLPEI
jgi:hypothetical protein